MSEHSVIEDLPAAQRRCRHRGRALVVDDDGGVRRVMSRVLAIEGLQVEQATDGEDGLRRGLAKPYEVILLDLQLPKLDGLSVLRRLRTTRPSQAVIMCSCQSDARTRAECLSLGASAFLGKPFSLAELWASVSAAMAGAAIAGHPA